MTPNRRTQLTTAVAAAAAVVAIAAPASASGSGAFPATIHATRINVKLANEGGGLHRGSPVAGKVVAQRVSLGGNVRAGLAEGAGVEGAVYPALSTDGGRHWHIDGPLFYRPAADAPNVTSRLAALGDNTLMAWGPGGNFVKTSTDRGAKWFTSNFPVGVHSAAVSNGELTVVALGNPTKSGDFPTRQYASTDGGLVWQRGAKLGQVTN
ncbi:MAG TPA: hypothetical protein VHW74_07180 [Mycobacteriales bacterium]|jgi:hypothetical protein|nr:hypothetical protein [Mycobacteriales bacterium]